ncbi:Uncharacterised protein [BD1-7 clade bacterium]|uniref:Uncharacterized protein n=1 Tax=BD1-7 clade bacterium TaxID=2029982 RepID=A0A5S9QX12_9GAMM|nr:Uncharacterised protein [BD1-7 clade bacterium]
MSLDVSLVLLTGNTLGMLELTEHDYHDASHFAGFSRTSLLDHVFFHGAPVLCAPIFLLPAVSSDSTLSKKIAVRLLALRVSISSVKSKGLS